jgi:hypothetical protein
MRPWESVRRNAREPGPGRGCVPAGSHAKAGRRASDGREIDAIASSGNSFGRPLGFVRSQAPGSFGRGRRRTARRPPPSAGPGTRAGSGQRRHSRWQPCEGRPESQRRPRNRCDRIAEPLVSPDPSGSFGRRRRVRSVAGAGFVRSQAPGSFGHRRRRTARRPLPSAGLDARACSGQGRRSRRQPCQGRPGAPATAANRRDRIAEPLVSPDPSGSLGCGRE